MSEYTEEQIESISSKLMESVREVKREAKVTPAKPDVVYLADAVDICNVVVTGNQVKQMLIKQKNFDALNKLDDLLAKYMPYMTLMGIALAGTGAAPGEPFNRRSSAMDDFTRRFLAISTQSTYPRCSSSLRLLLEWIERDIFTHS